MVLSSAIPHLFEASNKEGQNIMSWKGGPVGRVTHMGIDVNDLERAERFWTSLLGLKVSERVEDGPDIYVNFESLGGEPYFYIQQVPEKKSAKTRVHLDITVEDVQAAVSRAEELGAKKMQVFDINTVMEDPDGNEFCLVKG